MTIELTLNRRLLFQGDVSSFDALLEQGASVNKAAGMKDPPLFEAVWNDRTEMVSRLIKAGSDAAPSDCFLVVLLCAQSFLLVFYFCPYRRLDFRTF